MAEQNAYSRVTPAPRLGAERHEVPEAVISIWKVLSNYFTSRVMGADWFSDWLNTGLPLELPFPLPIEDANSLAEDLRSKGWRVLVTPSPWTDAP